MKYLIFYSSNNNIINSFTPFSLTLSSFQLTSSITMAPFAISLSPTLKPLHHNPNNLNNHFLISPLPNLHPQPLKPPPILIRFAARAAAGNGSNPTATTAPTKPPPKRNDRVQRVRNIQEFDNALSAAKERLVVVEYATMEDEESRKIYPFMVELSRTCNDVDFILVLCDESETTKELCEREGIIEVPHFSFYKSMQKIHDEAAVGPDMLEGDVLYYGDSHSGVVQLHSGEDVRELLYEHRGDDKLVVLDVGLKHCGPCVKVYPTVVKLSKKMDGVVFARMNGDENESCMKFLKDMNVIEVPTFLFIRNGEIKGRYVGSGKGELIGEILRYQGVRVTY